MKEIFNKNKIDHTQEPIFFGESLGSQRFDVFKVPQFETLSTKSLSQFWLPQEVSLQRDRSDFKNLTDAQKRIFTKNLQYQILLDSCQSRGVIASLLPIISIPELESLTIIWSFFELIHSRSYTYLIKNVYNNPSEVFDEILDIKEILERADSVTKQYNILMDEIKKIKEFNTEEEWKKIYKALYLGLVSVYILEGIRFYVSFACSFAFAEIKLMEGSAKIMELIARDEALHMSTTSHLINMIHETPEKVVPHSELMKIVVEENKDNVVSLFKEAVEQEKEWAEFLFKEGTMLGLSDKLLISYVEYLAGRRMNVIGIPTSYTEKHNPLPWTENWLSQKAKQVAPQESQKTEYLVGGVSNKGVDKKKLSL